MCLGVRAGEGGKGTAWEIGMEGWGAYHVEVAQTAGEVAVAGVVPREQAQQRRERLLPWSLTDWAVNG